MRIIQAIKVPEMIAVKSKIIIKPTTRDDLQKTTTLIKDIASFMSKAMGAQYKKQQQ